MSKRSPNEKQIIVLAYFHRYGWIAAMLSVMAVLPKQLANSCISAGLIVFSVWTFIGYRCRWRHIYCSYQNAYHRKMTPHHANWQQVRKSDAYGVPLICFLMGMALLCMTILR